MKFNLFFLIEPQPVLTDSWARGAVPIKPLAQNAVKILSKKDIASSDIAKAAESSPIER